MKVQKALVILAAMLAAASVMADEATKVIRKHCVEFDAAMVAKDIGWFDKISAPDYFEIDMHGKKTDRATAMASMKQMFDMMKVTSIKTTVLVAKQSGDTINTTCHSIMSAKMHIPNQPTKGNMKGDMVYDEVWVKKGGTWKIKSLKSIKESQTLDGKPIPSGMG